MAGVWSLLKFDVNLCSRGSGCSPFAALWQHEGTNQSLVWQWLPGVAGYPNDPIHFIWQQKQPLGIFAIPPLMTLAWQGAAAQRFPGRGLCSGSLWTSACKTFLNLWWKSPPLKTNN